MTGTFLWMCVPLWVIAMNTAPVGSRSRMWGEWMIWLHLILAVLCWLLGPIGGR